MLSCWFCCPEDLSYTGDDLRGSKKREATSHVPSTGRSRGLSSEPVKNQPVPVDNHPNTSVHDTIGQHGKYNDGQESQRNTYHGSKPNSPKDVRPSTKRSTLAPPAEKVHRANTSGHDRTGHRSDNHEGQGLENNSKYNKIISARKSTSSDIPRRNHKSTLEVPKNKETVDSMDSDAEMELASNDPIPLSYRPPPNEQKEPKKPKEDPISKAKSQLDNEQEELDKLSSRVKRFAAPTKDKEYLYLDDVLSKLLIRIDTINAHGDDGVRLRRKDLVKQVLRAINDLEDRLNRAARFHPN